MLRSFVTLRWLAALAVGTLAILACAPQAQPKPLTPIRFVLGGPTFTSGVAPMWIGQKLGYYAAEGLAPEFIPVQEGPAQSVQLLVANRGELAAVSPETALAVAARDPDMQGLVYYYNFTRRPIVQAIVRADSGIKEWKDLKGKKLGYPSQGHPSEFFLKAALRFSGLDPDKDVQMLAVGEGGPVARALERGEIQAYSNADQRVVVLTNLEPKVNYSYLPDPPQMKDMNGTGFLVRRDYLAQHQKELGAFGRVVAMSTAFFLANPEAGVRISWSMYPESKPKAAGDEEAMRQDLLVSKPRLEKFEPRGLPDPRWGVFRVEEWQAYVNFMGLTDKIADARKLYTNELVDEFNKFDRSKIEEQAKNYQ